MGSIVYVIVLICVIVAVVKRSGNITKSSGKKSGTRSVNAAQKKRPTGYTNYKPHKDIVSFGREMGDSKGSVLRDDRRNDWLAKQLRDEHIAFKITSEMFDLKIEHANHCDAKLIEQFHRRNCDASGIDLANGKTIKR